MREVFTTFLHLGLTSFGGPIAHLGYFRRTLVEERGWLDEPAYARIVALCSVLPGPTSSQVGMLIGLVRAGAPGALLACLGFTLPSAVLMALIAWALGSAGGHDPPVWFAGLLDGLFAAAAAVVAQAVLALGKSLCTDAPTKTRVCGGDRGAGAAAPARTAVAADRARRGVRRALVPRRGARRSAADPRSATVAAVAALVFVALLAVTVLPDGPVVALLATIVRAGSLVFGGGHVVLPLLHGLVADGLIGERQFFAGYGAAQAMPGPLFTFASYLGFANASPLHGALGALAATVLIFAPSFALIFAIAPVWNRLAALPGAGGALRGANASVVGLLGAVLYDPIVVSLGTGWPRVAIALAAYALIAVWNVAPWIVVLGAAALGALLGS